MGLKIFIIFGLSGACLAQAAPPKDFDSRYAALKKEVQKQTSSAEMSAAAVKLFDFCQAERKQSVAALVKKNSKNKTALEDLDKKWSEYLTALQAARRAVKPTSERGTMAHAEDQVADAEECQAFVNNLDWLAE